MLSSPCNDSKNMEDDQALRDRAYRIAEEKTGFYVHLAAFVMVNAGLWLLWYFTGRGFPWPAFITFFWGFGLVIHGVGAFLGGRYTQTLAEKEYRKLKEGRRP